jgi:hypothetical protein
VEVEAQVERCQISSTQDEEILDSEKEASPSPNVVFVVYSEWVMTAQNLMHASMVSSVISPHCPKTMPVVETSGRELWNKASMYRTQHVIINQLCRL